MESFSHNVFESEGGYDVSWIQDCGWVNGALEHETKEYKIFVL